MDDIYARTKAAGLVELFDDQKGLASMTPVEAALLARSLLSCAAAQRAPNSPPDGSIIDRAYLPATKWDVRTSPLPASETLTLTISEVEFDFRVSALDARAIATALASLADRIDKSSGLSGP
jgi:hypothetical protein